MGALVQDQAHDFGLSFLALLVERVKLRSNGAGARQIFGQEQPDHVVGVVHAACGIDARGDLEGHLAGGGRGSFAQTRDLEQCLQARIADAIQTFQSIFDDDAIFAGERNDVGHRRQRRQLEERLQHARQFFGPAKRAWRAAPEPA